MTQEKIQQYVGINFGKDIANEITNKTLVTLTPPKYSDAIEQRHVMWGQLVRKKQTNLMTALKTRLITLQAAGNADDNVNLEIANLENEIDDLEFEIRQKCPTS